MNTKRREAENNFEYREAGTIRAAIEEMKTALDKKKMIGIHENHHSERMNVEDEKNKKITQLENFWEDKLKEYNEKRENHLQRLHEKHKEEFTEYESKVREEIPNKSRSKNSHLGKKSAAILNQEKIMRGLAGKQKYKEAELMYEQLKKRVSFSLIH